MRFGLIRWFGSRGGNPVVLDSSSEMAELI